MDVGLMRMDYHALLDKLHAVTQLASCKKLHGYFDSSPDYEWLTFERNEITYYSLNLYYDDRDLNEFTIQDSEVDNSIEDFDIKFTKIIEDREKAEEERKAEAKLKREIEKKKREAAAEEKRRTEEYKLYQELKAKYDPE